jgi:hypothetical protein
MKLIVKTALVAISLAVAGSLAAVSPAAAQVSVQVGLPNIAFGYSDGYWDRDHHWHAWKDRQEEEHWAAANHEHYFARKHDRDRDEGWRDNDRYWEHH